MISLSLTLAVIAVLLVLAIANVGKSRRNARQNNNYEAIKCRNKTIIYSLLCIILALSIILNKEEFINNNQFNNCPMDEQMNATTPGAQVCPWAVKEHGSTVARVNFINLVGLLPLVLIPKKQSERVKVVRIKFERGIIKTFITRTHTIRSLPTIEQYLS